MHPLNKKYFGNTANTTIKVHYNIGNGVTSGYILHQTDTKYYDVTSNGIIAGNVKLSNVTNTALVPVGGMTILAYPVTAGVVSQTAVHATSIDYHRMTTAEGPNYIWHTFVPPAYSPGTDVLLHAVIETN
jgi:hypothetical protein